MTDQYADHATADAFLRKQVVLTAVIGAVAAGVLAATTQVLDAQERARLVAFGLGDGEGLAPSEPGLLAIGAIVVSLVVLIVALGTLVLHAARLAAFAFRKEVH